MITISINSKFDDMCVAKLDITDRITLVVGDTSTGKTHICELMSEHPSNEFITTARDSKGRKVDVQYINEVRQFKKYMLDKSLDGSVLVADEYVAGKLMSDSILSGQMSKTCKYFVLFQRDALVKIDVGVNSIFRVERKSRQYRFVRELNFAKRDYKLGNITKCNKVLIEDSKSGYKVLNHYFGGTERIDIESTHGKDKMVDKILEDRRRNRIVVGLDYDMGGAELYKLRKHIKSKEIKESELYLVGMESFEEVICNSELILSKCPELEDYVTNIDRHMSCKYAHRGKYFEALLRTFFRDDKGNSLYSKKNTHCFTTECKDCRKERCRFRDNGKSKAELIFANKYRILYEFYKYLQDEL